MIELVKGKDKRILLFIHMVQVAENTINGVLKKYPDSRLTLLLRFDVRKGHFEEHPNVESLILYKNVAMNPVDLFKRRIGFLKQIREKDYDVVIIPDKRFKSYIFSLLAKSKEKQIFNVDTSGQRLDSVHVYSNMANLGRVRLMARTLTKFLKNLKRHFSEIFKADISEELKSRYMKAEKSSYFGNSKPSESKKRLSDIANDMQYIIEKYSDNEEVRKMNSYKLLERVISEQCEIVDGIMKLKVAKEISIEFDNLC